MWQELEEQPLVHENQTLPLVLDPFLTAFHSHFM